jgi:transcriptional regulator with XRE-family HTH domain
MESGEILNAMELTPISTDHPRQQLQPRSKTTLRIRYESEARVLLQKMGGLEGIRQQLGLSQRKICSLLLVDPSAWSRWIKDESRTPPHVVRCLQWYMELEGKNPAWAQWREMVLKREFDPPIEKWQLEIEKRLNLKRFAPSIEGTEQPDEAAEQLRQQNSELRLELKRQSAIGLGFKVILLVNSLAVFYWIFRSVAGFNP